MACQHIFATFQKFSFILQSAALLILSSLTDINFSSLGWTGEKPSIPTFLFRITLKFWVSEDLDLLFNSVVIELILALSAPELTPTQPEQTFSYFQLTSNKPKPTPNKPQVIPTPVHHHLIKQHPLFIR